MKNIRLTAPPETWATSKPPDTAFIWKYVSELGIRGKGIELVSVVHQAVEDHQTVAGEYLDRLGLFEFSIVIRNEARASGP